MELAQKLHGFDIGRIFIARLYLGVASDETKPLDMQGQLADFELSCSVFFEVVEPKALKVSDNDVVWQFAFTQTIEVVRSLSMCDV